MRRLLEWLVLVVLIFSAGSIGRAEERPAVVPPRVPIVDFNGAAATSGDAQAKQAVWPDGFERAVRRIREIESRAADKQSTERELFPPEEEASKEGSEVSSSSRFERRGGLRGEAVVSSGKSDPTAREDARREQMSMSRGEGKGSLSDGQGKSERESPVPTDGTGLKGGSGELEMKVPEPNWKPAVVPPDLFSQSTASAADGGKKETKGSEEIEEIPAMDGPLSRRGDLGKPTTLLAGHSATGLRRNPGGKSTASAGFPWGRAAGGAVFLFSLGLLAVRSRRGSTRQVRGSFLDEEPAGSWVPTRRNRVRGWNGLTETLRSGRLAGHSNGRCENGTEIAREIGATRVVGMVGRGGRRITVRDEKVSRDRGSALPFHDAVQRSLNEHLTKSVRPVRSGKNTVLISRRDRQEILELAAEGIPARQICKKLQIPLSTVRMAIQSSSGSTPSAEVEAGQTH
ncbi:MAG: helix-turn-helix domain-containing protein [Candidatus Hydrogenedentota bacterium]|nr:MAG: helix-turn-helix domain-containing protein [Candidatus Hydrogenedentota bacterium]